MTSYVTIYLLTPWYRVLLEKLTGWQLVKKFSAFHGTRRFITALTSVRHLSLSSTSPIQYIYPYPTHWRSILILSTHLRLGLPIDLFPSGFPTKTLYALFLSPIRATCPTHVILLDFITRTILGEEYKSLSSSLCNLLHSPVAVTLLLSSQNETFHWNKLVLWFFKLFDRSSLFSYHQDPNIFSNFSLKHFHYVVYNSKVSIYFQILNILISKFALPQINV